MRVSRRTDELERRMYLWGPKGATTFKIICNAKILARRIQKIAKYSTRETIMGKGRLLGGWLIAASHYVQ